MTKTKAVQKQAAALLALVNDTQSELIKAQNAMVAAHRAASEAVPVEVDIAEGRRLIAEAAIRDRLNNTNGREEAAVRAQLAQRESARKARVQEHAEREHEVRVATGVVEELQERLRVAREAFDEQVKVEALPIIEEAGAAYSEAIRNYIKARSYLSAAAQVAGLVDVARGWSASFPVIAGVVPTGEGLRKDADGPVVHLDGAMVGALSAQLATEIRAKILGA